MLVLADFLCVPVPSASMLLGWHGDVCLRQQNCTAQLTLKQDKRCFLADTVSTIQLGLRIRVQLSQAGVPGKGKDP